MTNIDEVIKEFDEKFGVKLEYGRYKSKEIIDSLYLDDFTPENIKDFISQALTQQEELHRKELEDIKKKICEVSLKNEDTTAYGDGFEDAISKVMSIINNKLK